MKYHNNAKTKYCAMPHSRDQERGEVEEISVLPQLSEKTKDLVKQNPL